MGHQPEKYSSPFIPSREEDEDWEKFVRSHDNLEIITPSMKPPEKILSLGELYPNGGWTDELEAQYLYNSRLDYKKSFPERDWFAYWGSKYDQFFGKKQAELPKPINTTHNKKSSKSFIPSLIHKLLDKLMDVFKNDPQSIQHTTSLNQQMMDFEGTLDILEGRNSLAADMTAFDMIFDEMLNFPQSSHEEDNDNFSFPDYEEDW